MKQKLFWSQESYSNHEDSSGNCEISQSPTWQQAQNFNFSGYQGFLTMIGKMETEELYTLLSVWQQTNYELALSWEMLNLSNYCNGEE